ncbi:MAG: sulfurtransferase TusA family protein, partial [Candidatus Geothermarchaeales archaeon]
RSRIGELRVRCFKAYPDYQMFEIGVECAAVLVKLNDLMGTMKVGEVVHLVSDDPTADVEMERWADQTRHPVVDSRTEGNLMHFLVRKAGTR